MQCTLELTCMPVAAKLWHLMLTTLYTYVCICITCRFIIAMAAFAWCCGAGYDAHWQDPLEHLQFQSGTFHWLTARMQQLAAELCGGRLLMLLEGG